VLERTLFPLFRRVDFRGKGRLRRVLPVSEEGSRLVAFPGGIRLRLDLSESLQRDYLFGLYDVRELAIVRDLLAGGGDFVDVGAHIGLYTVAAALAVRGRGSVLALEPNPLARGQLEENLRLNRLDNATVSPRAVADAPGRTLLHVPASADPSFSSLEPGRFVEGTPVPVDVTTVDAEVEAAGLEPSLVKIDVEGGELAVVAGMSRTLEARPAVLVEVGPRSAPELERDFGARGYRGYRIGRRLDPGLGRAEGLFHALFLPALPTDRPQR
jgi:FkbM family methyltransferase